MVTDLIIDALLPGGGPSRRAMKVYRKGAFTTARIVGIRYEKLRTDFDPDGGGQVGGPVLELALQVDTTPTLMCGVEQMIEPIEHLRIGQAVRVRHRKDRAVLAADAGGGFTAAVPQRFVEPPAPGITDPTLWLNLLDRNRELAATITFTDARAITSITRTKIAATALVQGAGFDDFTVRVDDVDLRPYSSHLEANDYPLPGWARPGKKTPFVVDWATAAARVPGIGAPPGHFRQLISAAVSMDPLHGQVDPATSWSGQGLIDAANMSEPIGEVTFETWATALAHCKVHKIRIGEQPDHVQRQFGIPSAQWSDLSSHWSTQMRTNPRLMIALRQIEKQVKQQKKGR